MAIENRFSICDNPVAMVQARKRIVVRIFGNGSSPDTLQAECLAGYTTSDLEEDADAMEMLALDGRLLRIEWKRIKWVCFVRELPAEVVVGLGSDPERLLRKKFAARPRGVGLWVRLTLSDGDELEGLADNDRRLATGPGLLVTPPDTRSNTQRIFIPRAAIAALEVVSVVGARERARAAQQPVTRQPELFPALSPYGSDTDTIQ